MAPAGGMVEGTVHRVTYKSNINGFTILQINAVQVSGKPPPAPVNGAALPRKGAHPAMCLLQRPSHVT